VSVDLARRRALLTTALGITLLGRRDDRRDAMAGDAGRGVGARRPKANTGGMP